jgi:hypothetical protein
MVAESRPGYVASTGTVVRAEASPSHTAFQILRFGFTLLPILAGLDKFFYVLVDWGQYVSGTYAALSPFGPMTTMYIVGLIEIVAGLVVAVKPRIGAWLVGAWLALIIVNLILRGAYWDVALRDLGLMLGAFALARLAVVHDRAAVRRRRTIPEPAE